MTAQDIGHPVGHDYERGSPHLAHPQLRNWILRTLRQLVDEQFERQGRVRVLEIGAGHGAFTDHLLATGANVVTTEMSRASSELLRSRYSNNPCATVVFDEDGCAARGAHGEFDIVLCAAVLHHIPDYLDAVRNWMPLIRQGGSFASFADPLWYPRLPRSSLLAKRAAFYGWRLTQPELIDGLCSVIRRARGRYDESNPRDMVEYHVLRQGCDEVALAGELRRHFDTVEVLPYWSTPSRALQALGRRLQATSDFGLIARHKGNLSV